MKVNDTWENKLVSVIVPVYNVEKYISRCIDSIISQSFRNMEIILVDDGSTDNSLELCESYAQKDNRIKLIAKENEGSSVARNIGLGLAEGKYIVFIDSDDALESDFVETLLKAAELHRADICICGYKKNGKNCLIDEYGKTELITDRSMLGKALIVERRIGVMPWGKIYKKECIGNIRFIKGRINQDDLFCHQVFSHCSSVVKVNLPLYLYTENNTGVTYSNFGIRKIDILPIALHRLEVIEETWPEYLDTAMYIAACSFIDLHIEYAKRHLWNDERFTKKLMVDREGLFEFFMRHQDKLSNEIKEKVSFYYNNVGKIMLRDRVRYLRNAGVLFVKNYAHKLKKRGCEECV